MWGMKQHRFFIDHSALRGSRVHITDGDVVKQITRVFRMKTGDSIIVLDNMGMEYEVKIDEIGREIQGAVIKKQKNEHEPKLSITLYQSLCKKDKFEWILQKGTEVGITSFVSVIAEHSEKLGFNKERMEKITREAAEQSERGIIPSLGDPITLESAIQGVKGDSIVLDRSGENIKNYTLSAISHTLNIFVGPEGGWSEQELKVTRDKGMRIISLGSRVLRTETAGMIAAAILLNR